MGSFIPFSNTTITGHHTKMSGFLPSPTASYVGDEPLEFDSQLIQLGPLSPEAEEEQSQAFNYGSDPPIDQESQVFNFESIHPVSIISIIVFMISLTVVGLIGFAVHCYRRRCGSFDNAIQQVAEDGEMVEMLEMGLDNGDNVNAEHQNMHELFLNEIVEKASQMRMRRERRAEASRQRSEFEFDGTPNQDGFDRSWVYGN